MRRWMMVGLVLLGGCMPPFMNNNPNGNNNGGGPPPDPRYPPSRPTLSGSQLNLAPGETATDRALVLTRKLSETEEERKSLAAKVEQMKASMEEKDKALLQASSDIIGACREVAMTREELLKWKQDMNILRERLRSCEKENMANLQSIISLLEKILEKDKTPESNRDQDDADPILLPQPRRGS